MYLGIRTDSPLVEFYIFDGDKQVAFTTWQADRELAKYLLARLEEFLKRNNLTFHDLAGLFVYRGPGSFTGLRIGITVMNTAAYALSVPIIGSSNETWIPEAVSKLEKNENDKTILPFYGSEARITKPKK